MALNQLGHLWPPMVNHATIFSTGQLIHQCFEMDAVAFQACLKRAVLARGLVTWQATGVHYILENIVDRIVQYVDECCCDDEWHLATG